MTKFVFSFAKIKGKNLLYRMTLYFAFFYYSFSYIKEVNYLGTDFLIFGSFRLDGTFEGGSQGTVSFKSNF